MDASLILYLATVKAIQALKGGGAEMNAHLAHYCRSCREVLGDGQAVCPFCERQSTPIDEVTPYGPMCRNPMACAGKGSCPRDPCCGD